MADLSPPAPPVPATRLRALIVDDEPLARALIREYLAPHPSVQVVGEAADGLQAVQLIGQLAPDLVFLDIQMPRMGGLEVLQHTGLRRGVVFTTAHEQHALAAFDLHAVDYLLKPFSQARFDAALARARQLAAPAPSTGAAPADAGAADAAPADAALDRLLAAQQPRHLHRVLVRDAGGLVHVLPLDEVSHAEAQADYVAFHHAGPPPHAAPRTHLKAQRIADLQAQLDPQQFVRVHRSYIVNLRFLQALQRTDSQGQVLLLRTGQRIPVSRAGHERLRQVLQGG